MTDHRFRAITTRYSGFAFRSRLEARWAIFLDKLNVRWEYEPEGFELGNGLRYLPDFWLPEWGMWLEVKPDSLDHVSREKAARLTMFKQQMVYVTNGMPDRNGVLFYPTTDGFGQVPAFAYFTSTAPRCILTFPPTYEHAPEPWRDDLYIGAIPFDEERAAAGADMRDRAQEALYAARSARFEFGAKGGM